MEELSAFDLEPMISVKVVATAQGPAGLKGEGLQIYLRSKTPQTLARSNNEMSRPYVERQLVIFFFSSNLLYWKNKLLHTHTAKCVQWNKVQKIPLVRITVAKRMISS